MRNLVKTGVVLSLSILLSVTSITEAAPAKKAAASSDKVYCPLMDATVKKARALKSNYKGKTYYFCCDDCKHEFDKNPQKTAAIYNKKAAAHAKKKA